MIKVETDAHSGFCGGVIRAISTAEKLLAEKGAPLYSLGALVHNEEELHRLSGLGLESVGLGEAAMLPAGSRVIIRAHGEPPSTYAMLDAAGLETTDCTCPVVLRLQREVRMASQRSQVVIFGKIGHPEVAGLSGCAGDSAIVAETPGQIASACSSGLIDTSRSTELFSQTTMDPEAYMLAAQALKEHMKAPVTVHDSICSQVASRQRQLGEFARSHDVVAFVAGSSSSNGKVLLELCRAANPRTYAVCSERDLQPGWFEGARSAGVCGATSTPKWLLERVARAIENL